MSQTEQPKPNVTIEAHPNDFQNILAGIMVGIQAFIAVEPFIVQLIDIADTKKPTATVTIHPPV